MKFRRLSALAAAALLFGCHRPAAPLAEEPAAPPAEPETAASPSAAAPVLIKAPPAAAARRTGPPPAELWKEFSGARAMVEVKKQIDLGPRPSGSLECAQARALILESLHQAGWRTELQEFSDETPRGSVKFVNVIARLGQPPAGEGGQAIVCSHYDTKRFSDIRFVGASDGASSTGALLELARVLALDPAFAARFELVFFDGEEAVRQFTETDGLYGSRHYAQALNAAGRSRLFRLGLLWDMIGDRDLTITLPTDSPPDLARGVLASAEKLGARNRFSYFRTSLLDDHVPLNHEAHIPSIDLIDFDYLPWHTADDTLDKLSAESLQTVGAVSLHFLKAALPH